MTPRELYELARDALSLHDYETAKQYTDQLESLYPDNLSVLILSGTIAMKRGRFAEAAGTFERILSFAPDNVEALNNLGVALRSTGDMDSALTYLKRAYETDPQRADVQYNIANCLKSKRIYDEAIRYYRNAISLNPSFSFAYNNLGTIYESQDQTDRAITTYEEGLQYDTNHPTLRYNLGISLESQGDYEAAIREYKRSLKSRPGWPSGINNLGVALQKAGKLEEAERMFRDLVRIAPGSVKGNNNLGTVLAEQGKAEEAERCYRKALSLDAGYGKAALNLSSLKRETESPEEALKSIQALAAEFPDDVALQLRFVQAYIDAGKVHKAGVILAPLLKNDPDNGEAHCLMGRIRRQQGKKELAEQHFKLALKKDPPAIEAWLHLAYMAKDGGEVEQAMGAVGHYLEAKGDSHEGSLLLAELLIQKNLYTEALEMYQELYAEDSLDQRILTGLVNVNRMMGNQAEAVRFAKELVHTKEGLGDDIEIEELEESLDLYDKMTEEYAEEREKEWKQHLMALAKEETQEREAEKETEEETESLIDETIPDFGQDEAAIIDIGGIEPVIAIDEEEEELDLRELEEDIFIPDEIPDEEDEKDESPAPLREAKTIQGEPQHEPQEVPPPGGTEGYGAPPTPTTPGPSPQPQPSETTQDPKQPLMTQLNTPVIYTGKPLRKAHQKGNATEEPIEELKPVETSASHKKEKEETISENTAEESADLLAYLESLAQYLPEELRENFEESDMPLRMESLRAKLKGKEGLIKRLSGPTAVIKPEPLPAEPLRKAKVKDSFAFFDELASYLPAEEVKISLKQRIGAILRQIDGESE
ncbi:tetratricopeptide repeat protein [Sediminispirochaeta smaragdinae]|uniref:Tetratricopeptide TPR_2 repeat protein n=1 Tax=Sediminispirochaeta smaragdinae (strain DSM 11293 / JCM 15392 / SEBR 4228) TaxID=573413 RepID=E1R9J0_SEDSS|nr:tetratricopeptide repeat protein [Sediminispirochaeta smaragdinae]ADK83159.1 Tetratricopeptide TPR_2 repeat protein [Sediminispirochaeta smaragdinae DSM 11293]